MSVVRVIAAVCEREGRWLIAKRPAAKRHGGLWEFPGGKLEPGENDVDAAIRELREELGVDVTAVGDVLAEIGDAGTPFLIVFAAVLFAGEAVALEHEELAWVAPHELPQWSLAPSDRRFVERWLSR